jgi:hypothetical protein
MRTLLSGALLSALLLSPVPQAASAAAATTPSLRWSTYFGGTGFELGTGVALDAAGNVYLAAKTSADGLATAGAAQMSRGGGSDALVAKFSPTGTLLWATYLGGAGNEETYGLVVDGGGNACIVGYTNSTDFPRIGGFQLSNAGFVDVFVAKLSPSGAILWSSYLGGSSNDYIGDIAADAAGNIYVTGWTDSPDFPLVNAFRSTLGLTDAFVTKIASGGGSIMWSTFLGGNDTDAGHGLVVDSTGAVIVVGETISSDFPTAGGFQTTPGGYQDGFVAKILPDGSGLAWGSYLGGNISDVIWDVAVDSPGNIYVTGLTSSTDFPLSNALQSAPGPGFVTRINANGSGLVWSTYFPGVGWGLALDGAGKVYVTGKTSLVSLPIVDAYQSSINGPNDTFITRISNNGSAFEWSTYFGGTVGEQAWEIAVNPTGTTIALVGETTSPDFPTLNGYQSTLTGATAAFLTVFDAAATGPGGGIGPAAGGGCGLMGLECMLLTLLLRYSLRLR